MTSAPNAANARKRPSDAARIGLSVTLAAGPGANADDLIQQLAARGLLQRVIRMWPDLSVEDYGAGRSHSVASRKVAWYRHLTRWTWATWLRLPWVSRYRHPQGPLLALYDHLASRYIEHPDIFLGWPQVSLRSLRRARARGSTVVLEHPMFHVDAWQERMKAEYERHAPDTELFYSIFPAAVVRRMRREYDEADFILLPSQAAVETFRAADVPARKLVRVPLGVDTSIFVPQQRSSGQPLSVLYVGRLELLKGVHYLLQSWHHLGRRDADLRLVGPLLPEMKPWLERYAASGTLVLGSRPRGDLPRLYQSADLVVFPSVLDGFGLVILEAMGCGCPVIASRASGGPDVIEDGREGFLVDPGDTDALRDRLVWACDHRDELREMGMRARRKVLTDYTIEHYGDRLCRALASLPLRTSRAVDPSRRPEGSRGGSPPVRTR